MRLTDTHCHLDFSHYDKDREKVIAQAKKAGLEKLLVLGIDVFSSKAAIRLAEKFSFIFAAIGVHPNSGKTWNKSALTELKSMVQHPKVVAVGEIGLDFYRDSTPQNLQKKIFREQLEFAFEFGKPVIIHCREAFKAVLKLLAEWQSQLKEAKDPLAERPGVLHSYSGNVNQMNFLMKINFFIGISGPVTYNNSHELRQVVSRVPINKMLIETDSPFLTPHPYRGKRNEPAYVSYVAERIAEILQKSPLEIGEITSNNSKKLFNW